MIALVEYFKLADGVGAAALDELLRSARARLLRIPGTLTVRAGRSADESQIWDFILYQEFESVAKMQACLEDPLRIAFAAQQLGWLTRERRAHVFDLDPSPAILGAAEDDA